MLASQLFVDLLSPQDYLGIISFNSEADEILPLSKIHDNKNEIKRTLTQNSASSGYTDYKKAFDLADNQLSSLDDENIKKLIVFITDGQPSVDGIDEEEYLNDMWGSVENLKTKNYPVYSIGLGQGVDRDILESIASETRGDTIFTQVMGDLTFDLYKILVGLKNSKVILDESLVIDEDKEIEFVIDEFTDKVTLVVVNEPGDLINLTPLPPSDVRLTEGVSVTRNDEYTIVNLQQVDNHLVGDWKFNIYGKGNISVYGAKDISFRSSIVSPSDSVSHPLNEELEVRVALEGRDIENLSVDMYISKGDSTNQIKLETTKADNYYIGTFNEADSPGLYIIETRVMYQGRVLSSESQELNVKYLPSIISDFGIRPSGYNIGDKINLTASLNIGSAILQSGKDLRVDDFSMNLLYGDETIISIPLRDDGSSGDLKANDGYYSGIMNFEKSGDIIGSLVVKGIYRGEEFVLEKNMGEIRVNAEGRVRVELGSSDTWELSQGDLYLPITIQSLSDVNEVIIMELDPSIGSIESNRIEVGARENKNSQIIISLEEGVSPESQPIFISLSGERATTEIQPLQLRVYGKISQESKKVNNIFRDSNFLIYLIVSILSIPILYFLIGKILYVALVNKKSLLKGVLSYRDKEESGEFKRIDISLKGKEEFSISFDDDKKPDLILTNPYYSYDIVLRFIVEKEYKDFVAGWKALKGKLPMSYLEISCSSPGYLVFDRQVYNSKVLNDGDTFSSGNYDFEFNRVLVKDGHGKNVLEGRI